MAEMKEILKKITERGSELEEKDLERAMNIIMDGHATQAQISGFLVGLKMIGEKPWMIATCARVLREHSIGCDIKESVVDIVGTGGDGLDTFNASTTAAIVAAACGVKIAKHGNRSSSSMCGSADILEAAGVKIDLDPQGVKEVFSACGICFLFAQKFHPSMKHVAGIRKELGLRTVFNVLGPLSNPAKPEYMLAGVFSHHLGDLMIETFKIQGLKCAMVVCGEKGLDEISPEGVTKCWLLKDGEIETMELRPEDFGVTPHTLEDVKGGNPEYNVKILHSILNGEQSSFSDWVVMNTAALLFVTGHAFSFKEGADKAKQALRDSSAKKLFENFVATSIKAAHK